MAAMIETINRWSADWTELAWAVTWQSAALVGLAAVVAVFLRRSSPGLRYWIWQIVAIKLLLMPFWTMALPAPFLSLGGGSQQAGLGEPTEFKALPADGSEEFTGFDSKVVPPPARPSAPQPYRTAIRQVSWQSWLMIGWLLVVVAQFAALARQRSQLRRLLREAAPVPEPLHALVGELAEQLGLRHAPTAVTTKADSSFFACGAWRPVLVLPEGLLATLGGDRLRQVLLHELAHVKRLDLILGWPVEIARRLLFHPMVHWLAYRIRLERELACDQMAMAASGRSPGEYIETLLHVVTQASQPEALKAVAVSAGADGNADGSPSARGEVAEGIGKGDIP